MIKRIFSVFLASCCVMAFGFSFSACDKTEEKVLRVYNWGEFIAEDVLDMFYEETGIKIEYDTYNENEAMYTKVKNSGDNSYDVIVPSDYMVKKMADEGMLHELNFDNIPNIKNLDPMFTENRSYDPDGKYSIPYLWGTIGILYNKELVGDVVIDSVEDLFDYENFSGQICMLDSVRDSIGISLKSFGYSMNDIDPEHIRQAKEKLLEQKKHLLAYGTDDLVDKVSDGTAALALVYSGEGVYAAEMDDNLCYVIPKEGTNIAVDCFAILESSENKEEAEAFLNFMLRPDIAQMNSEETGYASPNTEAKKLMDPEVLDDPAVYPDDELLGKCEEFITLNNKYFNEAWDEVKAG